MDRYQAKIMSEAVYCGGVESHVVSLTARVRQHWHKLIYNLVLRELAVTKQRLLLRPILFLHMYSHKPFPLRISVDTPAQQFNRSYITALILVQDKFAMSQST
jgi:hypothetical protein